MNLTAAVGTLRVADAVGASVDRSLLDYNYYFRVSNTFRADAGLRFAHSDLNVAYGLRLMPNTTTLRVEPFHTAEMRYIYTTPRFVLSLSETGGIGKQSFLGIGRASPLAGLAPVQDSNTTATTSTPALATPSPIDASLLPGVQSLPVVSSRTAASATYRWDRTLSSTFTLGYQIAGGLTERAKRYLSLQQLLDAGASLDYALDARNNLVSALVFARGTSSRNDDYVLTTVSESWLYKATLRTTLDIGGGVSGRSVNQQDGSTLLAVTPVGNAGIAHILQGRDRTGVLRFAVRFAPLVDTLTARIQNRFSAQGSATMNQGDWSTGVTAGLARTIPSNEPGALNALTASVFGSYQIVSWLGASLSAQVTRQEIVTTGLTGATAVPSGVAWGVYGGLYGVSPTWEF